MIDGEFQSFNSGGTDISDTTAVPSVVLSGYYFYTADGTKTEGSVNINNATDITISGSHTYNSGYYPTQWTVTSSGIDTSDATALARNIEKGYTAYCRGLKITGNAYVDHGVIAYPNSVASIPKQLYFPTNISCGDHMVIAGGANNAQSSIYRSVYIYNSELVQNSSVSLPENKFRCAGAYLNDCAIIVGGQLGDTYANCTDTVHIIDNNYTVSNGPSLSSAKIFIEYINGYEGGRLNDNYVIFPGGYSSEYLQTVDVYDTSFTRSMAQDDEFRYNRTICSIDNYCIIIGDVSYQHQPNVAYNTSLTKQTISATTIQTTYKNYSNHPRGIKRGNYALFGGGSYYNKGNVECTQVYAFDSELVFSTISDFSYKNGIPCAFEFLYFSVFGQAGLNQLDLYDDNLVHKYLSITNVFYQTGYYGAFGSINKQFGLCCGGYSGSSVNVAKVIVET